MSETNKLETRSRHQREEIGKLHSQVDRLEARVAELTKAIETIRMSLPQEVDDAVTAEREACAETAHQAWLDGVPPAEIVVAIRARGAK